MKQTYSCKLRPAINPTGRLARQISIKTTWLFDAWLYRDWDENLYLVVLEHNGRCYLFNRSMHRIVQGRLSHGRFLVQPMKWNDDVLVHEVTTADRWVAGRKLGPAIQHMHDSFVMLLKAIKPKAMDAQSLWCHYFRLDEHTTPIPASVINHWVPGRGMYKQAGETLKKQWHDAQMLKLDSLIKN